MLIMLLSALTAVVLGLRGFTEVSCVRQTEEPKCAITLVQVRNSITSTISLFYPGPVGELSEDLENNSKLSWARMLAAFATTVAAFEVLFVILESVGQVFTRIRVRWRHNDTIIVGCGERGQCFLHDCQNARRTKLVVIDREYNPSIAQNVKDAGALFILGDARSATLLGSVGIAWARQLIILGGNDSENLEVLAAAQSIKRKRFGSLKILVRVDQPLLVRQLNREDDFARRDGFDVAAFNIAAATARCFFRSHPLVDQAELRAQQRVHLVCIGWTPIIFAMLEQVARLSPFQDFHRPLVHLFVPDENSARTELLSAQPAIFDVLDIEFDNLDYVSSIPTLEQIVAVEPNAGAAVTTILVSVGNDADTAAAALAIRERSQQSNRWRAPVYSHMKAHSALSSLLEEKSQHPDPGKAVIPIGFHEDACRLDSLFGEREKLARQIHESYLSFKGIGKSSQAGAQDENNQPWNNLRQTYRLACRRAADHFPIKVLSIGAIQNGLPFIVSKNLGFASSKDELDSLSELEHKSWEIDRYLDGWRSGTKRDDLARIHPALIPFEKLSDEIQEFDRDQIRAIAQRLFRQGDAPTVKREKRLGIFGHNKVTHDEHAHMLRELDQSVMPKLIHRHRHDFISVCTPLAPGSDTILTEAVLERLKKADINHRLVVIRTLPLEIVIDDFMENFTDENAWRAANEVLPPDDLSDVKKEMLSHLSAIPASVPKAFIADLTPPGLALDDFSNDKEKRLSAYVQAASWLIDKSDILIAFHDPQRGDGRTGGTRETLQRARTESTLRHQRKLRIEVIEP